MNSAQLASRAGVSVRMLRYYHKGGVLDEPPRSANGYRQYDTQDLIRVLRIKRLAALGFSLKSMPPLLDENRTHSADSWDELDRELEEEINRLSYQRHLLARARGGSITVDQARAS
ncbi:MULTISPECIES: MerR family transcriptional regulator [Actinomycetes]|uniref:MerR family transcriptional regulator n=1 Tax=Actinomycetes TaxID=1760 RepID=UPI00364FD2D8